MKTAPPAWALGALFPRQSQGNTRGRGGVRRGRRGGRGRDGRGRGGWRGVGLGGQERVQVPRNLQEFAAADQPADVMTDGGAQDLGLDGRQAAQLFFEEGAAEGGESIAVIKDERGHAVRALAEI